MPIRIRAFLIHLAFSFALAAVAIALAFLVWYPGPLAKAVGMSDIFFMMLGIDVILGPLLTLIVYNPAKKSLRFDLAVIVAVQLAAFAYGLMAIAEARPAWYVFNKDRFDLAQATDLDTSRIALAKAEYRRVSWTGPQWVASVTPPDRAKATELLMESGGGGPDLPQRIDLYVPLADEKAAMLAKAHDVAELARYNAQAAVDALLKSYPKANAWLPLMARITPMTVLIDKTDGAIIAVVDLRPWND